jgi:hypothetical protein
MIIRNNKSNQKDSIRSAILRTNNINLIGAPSLHSTSAKTSTPSFQLQIHSSSFFSSSTKTLSDTPPSWAVLPTRPLAMSRGKCCGGTLHT